MSSRPQVLLALAIIMASGCQSPDLRAREAALRSVLEQEQAAHLGTDATLLSSLLADSLVMVQGGRVIRQSREAVRAQFERYFEGARYELWEDITPPELELSADGSVATVIRSVRVRRSQSVSQRAPVPEAFESAWIAHYRWVDGGWKMTSNASGVLDEAQTVLRAGTRSVDPDSQWPNIWGISFSATASGPGGDFEVEVRSARDGSARLEFLQGIIMSVLPGGAWQQVSGSTETAPLTLAEELFVRGHEVLAMIAWPQERVPTLRFSGRTQFDGRDALRLSGTDALSGGVDVFFGAADTLPLGFRVRDHLRGGGPVSVTYSDWRETERLTLPRTVRFSQGTEVFTYALREPVIQRNPDLAWFEEPSGGA